MDGLGGETPVKTRAGATAFLLLTRGSAGCSPWLLRGPRSEALLIHLVLRQRNLIFRARLLFSGVNVSLAPKRAE